MITRKGQGWMVAGLLFLASVALVVIAGIVPLAMKWLKGADAWLAEVALTVVLIAGVGGLLILLSFVVSVFAALDLSERTGALGLPEGSIRAVIALSLILIFAIQAIFLYQQIGGTTTHYRGITQEQLDAIPTEQIVSIQAREQAGKTVFDVDRRVEESAASVDFGKQILTTVSTLVVAVAGFYFGTRAVAVARGAEELPEPVIHSIDPKVGNPGDELDITILGENLQLPKTVKLEQGAKGMPCEYILSSATKITGKLKIGRKEQPGKWDVVVVNKDGRPGRKPEEFDVQQPLELTPPTPPSPPGPSDVQQPLEPTPPTPYSPPGDS